MYNDSSTWNGISIERCSISFPRWPLCRLPKQSPGPVATRCWICLIWPRESLQFTAVRHEAAFACWCLDRLRSPVPASVEQGSFLWEQQAQTHGWGGGGDCSPHSVIAVFRLSCSKSLSAMADDWVNKHEKLCHWPTFEPEAACLSWAFRMKDVRL